MPTDEELNEIFERIRGIPRRAIDEPYTLHEDAAEVVLIIPAPGNIGEGRGFRKRPPHGNWEPYENPIPPKNLGR